MNLLTKGKLYIWLSLLLAFSNTACIDWYVEELLPNSSYKVKGSQVFHIKQGSHTPILQNNQWAWGKPVFMNGSFILYRNNWYSKPDRSSDWNDINKLIGVGQNKEHSWRLGYRNNWNKPNRGILYFYYHGPENINISDKGFYNAQRKFGFFPITEIVYDRSYEYFINFSSGTIVIYETGDGTSKVIAKRSFKPGYSDSLFGKETYFLMNPYHGGDKKAPKDLLFRISWDVTG